MKLNNNFKERTSLGQDVFEYLKKAIIDQTIEPGSRLVESRLADLLGISRTPLREALHKLEREEWIEKNPSGGFQVVTLTRDDIEQTFGIRSVLEAYAARLAAENYQDRDLIPLEKKMKEFHDCLDRNERAGKDADGKFADNKESDRLQTINTEFHDLLYALSKSPKLVRMINQLRSQISRFRQIILKQKEYAIKSNEDHKRMVEAIRNRDGDAVEQLVRQHIIKGKNAVLDGLKQEDQTGG